MQTIYLAAGGSSGGVSVDRGKLSESLQKVFEATPEQIESVWSGISEATGGGNIYLLITFFAVSIGVSFFCSIWEAVLLSITRPFIADYKKKKPKTGAKLEFLKDQLDQPLTAILTLNTVAHTVGAMGVGREVSKLVGGGWLETAAGVFMTLAVLIASEIIPKNLGAKNWRSWAGWVSTALYALTKFWPMRLVIMVIGLFSKGGHHKPVFNRDELEVMAEMGRDQGQLKEEESRILTNLLNLRDTKVDDVMTPRVVIFALQHDSTVQEYVNEHADSPFSRIPIFTENRDDIGGFVLKDDILLAAAQDKLDVTLLDLKRDVLPIMEESKLTDVFEKLMGERQNIAIVHDEFGGVTGLVTMEDIVETLLGLEIVDEADTKEDMQAFARGLWQKRAERMGIDIVPSEEEGGDPAPEPEEEEIEVVKH